MPQSAIGTRIGLALAAKENFSYPADFLPAEGLLAHDLAEVPRPVRDEAEGVLKAPLWPELGIGVEPDPELLEKFSLARATVKKES
jgi:hypothetical protein